MEDKLDDYKMLFENLTVDKMRQELADEALEKKWKELNMGIEQWKHKYLYPFGQIEPIQAPSIQSTQASTVRGHDASQLNTSVMTAGGKGGAHPSLDIGYNNPSKLNDSIYSEGSQYLHGPSGGPRHNDSVSMGPHQMQSAMQNMVSTDAFSQMTQQKYLFPSEQITNRDWFVELQRPLNITVADIRRDFTKFIKDFPMEIIPHTSDEELAERNTKHKINMRAAIRRGNNNRLPSLGSRGVGR